MTSLSASLSVSILLGRPLIHSCAVNNTITEHLRRGARVSHEKLDFVQPYITAALQPRHILEQEFILLSEYFKCQH